MKVTFNSLRFKNFRGFGNALTDFNFHTGFNLITGKNGSGKTTINEILHFVLFGKSYSGVNISELINRRNKKNAYGELEFQIGEDIYLLKRGIKPDILEFLKNGEPIKVGNQEVVDSSKALIQERINSILGINPSIYRQIVSIHNDEGSRHFLSLPEKDKKDTLEHIFNLKVFGKILDDAKEKSNLAKQAYEVLTRERDGLNATFNANESAIKSITSIFDSFEKNKKETIENLKTQLSSLKDEEKEINSQIETLIKEEIPSERLQELRNQLSEIEKSIISIDSDIRSKNQEIDRINNETVNPFLKDSGLPKLEEDMREREREIRANSDKFAKWEQVKNDLKKFPYSDYPDLLSRREEIVSDSSKLTSLKEKLDQLNNQTEGACSKCFQIVTGDHLETERKEVSAEIDALKLHLDQSKEKIKSDLIEIIDERVSTYGTTISNLKTKQEEDLENKSKLVGELATKWTDQKNKSKKSINKEIEKLQESKKEKSEKIPILKDSITKLETTISTHNSNLSTKRERLNNVKKSISDTETRIETESTKTFDSSGLDKARKDNEEISPKITEKNLKIEIEKKNARVYDEIKRVMAKDGIKKYFFARLIPRLNQIINDYLKFFQLNIVFSFDDVFVPTIIDGFGVECSFKSFSDGEKQRISTSIMLSFIALNKIINDFSCNLMFVDEVFDGLDNDGIDLAFEKLKDISDREGSAVYVISHKNMEAWHGIDQTIEFEKINGFSNFKIK